jgi:Protein of unknown function with PCYCGC motif
MRGRLLVAGLLTVGLAAAAGAWWLRSGDGEVTVDSIGDKVQTVPRGRLPVFAAAPGTAELYRFAATRGELLSWMPCTCGCGALGHTSNRACYIKGESATTTTFTSHAAT